MKIGNEAGSDGTATYAEICAARHWRIRLCIAVARWLADLWLFRFVSDWNGRIDFAELQSIFDLEPVELDDVTPWGRPRRNSDGVIQAKHQRLTLHEPTSPDQLPG